MIDIVHHIIYNLSKEYQRKFQYDFRKVLSACLNGYICYLTSTNINPNKINYVRKICRKLIDVLHSSYSGRRSTSYIKLKNVIKEFQNEDGFFCEFDSETFLYRMRVCDIRKDIARKELFHIPFSQIRNIKTQRYSTPGYPCLYLARSIYGCWEEMHRPSVDSTLVSVFKAQNNFGLVDLRIPTKERFEQFKDFYISFFPLIIACSIPVLKADSVFKPEYIIPQFVLEWLIEQKFGYECMGLTYTSAFMNNEFFTLDYEWDNIVMPVQVIKTDLDYCPVLSTIFNWSKPTCCEYERMLGTFNNDGLWSCGPKRLKTGHPDKHAYYYSIFSSLEEELETRELHGVYDDI